MKPSNKILIAASVVILAYLTVYDLALQAEYRKGTFKSPLYQMQPLSFKNFSSIKHNAANLVTLKIEKGPYGVWIADKLKGKINITQNGGVLTINLPLNEHDYSNGFGNGITITCPSVNQITTTALFIKGDKPHYPDFYYAAPTTISGFNQQNMVLQANDYTNIELEKNILTQLYATAGDQLNGRANLTINNDNQIKVANLTVPGKSKLLLLDPTITQLNCKITDSAEVQLTGKAAHLLNKP